MSESFQNWCRVRFGSDVDKIDIVSEYDSALSEEENKAGLESRFSSMVKRSDGEVAEAARSAIDQGRDQELRRHAREEEELVASWKESAPRDIHLRCLELPRHFVRMTVRGITHGTMLVGPGGLGKSYMTINTVKAEGIRDFVYKNTYTTPLALYRLLYNHRDRLIILDDVQGLFENEKSLAILKSALWEVAGKRLICMETTAREAQDLPSTFEFRGGILLLANAVNLKDPNVRALVSRVNFYELKFTHAEMLRIMEDLVEEPYKQLSLDERRGVYARLKARVTPAARNLSLRTLIRAYDFYIYDRERLDTLLTGTIQTDAEAELILDLMRSGRDASAQMEEWKDRTCKSRASFFRKKREMMERMGAWAASAGLAEGGQVTAVA